MAKRQHFSCPLRTATLSLKFENVVPAGWILFFPCYIQVPGNNFAPVRAPSTSWSSHKTDHHSIGFFALFLPYYNTKFGTMVPEPAVRLHMLELLESEMISSRNVMSSKSPHVRRCLDTTVQTKLRNLCTADGDDSRCEHSLRHDRTIDVFPIA